MTFASKAFHSNSERGYLKEVMQPKLTEKLGEIWDRMRSESLTVDAAEYEILEDKGLEVHVSLTDRDPFEIVSTVS